MKPIAERMFPEVTFGNFTRMDGTVAFYTRIHALLQPEFTFLDLGCGRGSHSEDPSPYRRGLHQFRGRCAKVIGIDVDPAGRGNPGLDEFRLIEDVHHWPLEDGSVDMIVSDNVLEHVPEPGEYFREAHRVLRTNGYLCLRTPNVWSYVAIIAKLIPSRMHAKVLSVAQPSRQDMDVFPTVYRCNTRRKLSQCLAANGFRSAVYYNEAEPGYFGFSSLAYRCAVMVNKHLPDMFKTTLFAYAQKV